MNPPNPQAIEETVNVWIPILIAIITAICGAVVTIYGKIQDMKAQLATHSDRIHDLALASPAPAPAAVPASAPDSQPASRPPMAALGLLIATAILFVAGCASDGTLTPQGQRDVSNAVQLAGLALNTYAGFEAAKSGGKVSPAQVASLASADLAGIAALAQANVGATPAAAQLAQGASNPAAAQPVVAALPQTAITQGTVNTLFAAAQKIAP